MSDIRVTVIPQYMIETGEVRRLLPAWATELSVFYLYIIDWVYMRLDPCSWWRYYWSQRN